MLTKSKNFSLSLYVNVLLWFFPISFIIGSLFVTVNFYLFLILCIFFIKEKKLKFEYSYTNIILISFFLLIIISTFNNLELIKYKSFFKSILLLRFAVLYIVMDILIKNNEIDLKKFFISCLFCSSFLSLDVIIQYVFGYDLFGYTPFQGRITGFFGAEGVAGDYIRKYSLISLFGLLFLFKEENLKRKIMFSFLIIFQGLAIFLASNRMSVPTFILGLFLLFLFYKRKRLTVVFSFIILASISLILIKNDIDLNNKYKSFTSRFVFDKSINNVEKKSDGTLEKPELYKKIKIFNKYSYTIDKHSHHALIYLTALKVWKTSPIIGTGYKSFMQECIELSKKDAITTCSTHVHNYHFQILQITGILGFVLISLFIFIILFKVFLRLKNKVLDNDDYAFYFIPIILTLLVEIWPIKSTGNLFSTWNGTYFWMITALSGIVVKSPKQKSLVLTNFNKKYLITIFTIILLTSLSFKGAINYLYLNKYFPSFFKTGRSIDK